MQHLVSLKRHSILKFIMLLSTSSSSNVLNFTPTLILSRLSSSCKAFHIDSVQGLKLACYVVSASPLMPLFESLKAKIQSRIDEPIRDDILAKMLIAYPGQAILCREHDLVQIYNRTALCPGASTQLRLRKEYGIALTEVFHANKAKLDHENFINQPCPEFPFYRLASQEMPPELRNADRFVFKIYLCTCAFIESWH